MKTKSKSKFIIIGIIAVLIAAIGAYLAKTNRTYTFEIRPMLGATYLDGNSYIEFADFEEIKYYDSFLHYEYNSETESLEGFGENLQQGAFDILNHYSNECDFIGEGTQIKCEPIEQTRKKAVLHYYGIGITSSGTKVNIDDYWEYNIGKAFDGEMTTAVLLTN